MRIRSRLASISAASALALAGALTVLPGTALMASVAYPMGTDAGGAVTETLHYDDQTLLITDLTIVNNANQGSITVTCYQLDTSTVVFGPRTYTAKSGTTVQNLRGLGQHMVEQTGVNKYGPYDVLVPPVDCTFAWQGQ